MYVEVLSEPASRQDASTVAAHGLSSGTRVVVIGGHDWEEGGVVYGTLFHCFIL